jgi:ankyrin repeat protein
VLLLMAASENDTPKVEELLGAGANINIADNKGKSPLELATKQEVKDLLEVRLAPLVLLHGYIVACGRSAAPLVLHVLLHDTIVQCQQVCCLCEHKG